MIMVLYLFRDSLKFSFHSVIQEDMEKIVAMWNNHCIRKGSQSNVSGMPNQLYYLPEVEGKV